MIPNPEFEEFLRQLEQDGLAHDAAQSEHRQRRLNLENPTARLLQLLILYGSRIRVLKIVTSNYYSALWIANAFRRIPGAEPLITIERDPEKAAHARQNLSRAGLMAWTDVRLGDATEIVAQLVGPFDAVFFDADRVSAHRQLSLLIPKLSADVLLLADNALSHPAEIAPYIEVVSGLTGFLSLVVPIGKGLHVAHRLQG